MPATVPHVSPYSGSWYPADRAELEELLDRVFSESRSRTGAFLAPRAAAFVVPHAGLMYSGTVAAVAYRHLEAEPPGTVLLLGFSHHGASPGVWMPDIDAFRTPLGEVEVDGRRMRELASAGAARILPEAALCDHSIEIQLPLLQRAAPGAKVVPLYISQLTAEGRQNAAASLAELSGPGTILVASSDLTHYGRAFSYQPFPVDDWTADRLQELDEKSMEAAGSLSPQLFLDTLRSTGATVCGHEPIALLLATLRLLDRREEIFQETLDYQTSGEITGDYQHSVSYGALGYFPHTALRLAPEDQRLLIGAARATLDHYLRTGSRKPIGPQRRTPALERRAAAFVTLHSRGELRGCVGRRASTEPLAESVPLLALSAALEDSRFEPVERGETGLEMEISVLSPMKRMPDLAWFRVNEHGALLESGPFHGLLLPQVAAERNWTAAQFLDALTRKAGAGRDVYRDPSTRVFVFRAQVIPEHEL